MTAPNWSYGATDEAAIERVATVLRDRLRPPFDPYEVTCHVLDVLLAPVNAVTVERDDLRAVLALLNADQREAVPADLLAALYGDESEGS